METIFMNTENSKMNELHKLVLNLLQKLDLKSNKSVAVQSLSICYTWKNVIKQYKNMLKIIAPTWNDEFELPDGFYSVSDIQDYIEFIINEHETLTTIILIHVHINRINIRLLFRIKDGYELEQKLPDAMKLFGSTS